MVCDCKGPGWCPRHRINKLETWYNLCKKEDYFNAWESGTGPGQRSLTEKDREAIKDRIKTEAPTLSKRAWHFSKALVRFISTGARKVTEEQYEERLTQCDQCVFREDNQCLHKSCGCNLSSKAEMKSEDCPIGRWPSVE